MRSGAAHGTRRSLDPLPGRAMGFAQALKPSYKPSRLLKFASKWHCILGGRSVRACCELPSGAADIAGLDCQTGAAMSFGIRIRL